MPSIESPSNQPIARHRPKATGEHGGAAAIARLTPAVDALHAAWTGGPPLDGLPSACRPRDPGEGHYIQDRLVERLDRPVRGWKLAVTSDAALTKTGLDGPIYGRLFDGAIIDSPATRLSRDFNGAKMEPEIAVRLATPLGGPGATVSRSDTLAAVEGLYLAIELAASRFLDPDAAGFASQIADNAGTGALIVGQPIGDWRNRDLSAIPLALIFDGETVAEGFAPADRCDPIAVVTWLANELSFGGLALQAGDMVTTGTLAQPTYCPPGTEGRARFEEIGEVRLTFA